MNWLVELHNSLYAQMGSALYYAIGFITIIALLAQWKTEREKKESAWRLETKSAS